MMLGGTRALLEQLQLEASSFEAEEVTAASDQGGSLSGWPQGDEGGAPLFFDGGNFDVPPCATTTTTTTTTPHTAADHAAGVSQDEEEDGAPAPMLAATRALLDGAYDDDDDDDGSGGGGDPSARRRPQPAGEEDMAVPVDVARVRRRLEALSPSETYPHLAVDSVLFDRAVDRCDWALARTASRRILGAVARTRAPVPPDLARKGAALRDVDGAYPPEDVQLFEASLANGDFRGAHLIADQILDFFATPPPQPEAPEPDGANGPSDLVDV